MLLGNPRKSFRNLLRGPRAFLGHRKFIDGRPPKTGICGGQCYVRCREKGFQVKRLRRAFGDPTFARRGTRNILLRVNRSLGPTENHDWGEQASFGPPGIFKKQKKPNGLFESCLQATYASFDFTGYPRKREVRCPGKKKNLNLRGFVERERLVSWQLMRSEAGTYDTRAGPVVTNPYSLFKLPKEVTVHVLPIYMGNTRFVRAPCLLWSVTAKGIFAPSSPRFPRF